MLAIVFAGALILGLLLGMLTMSLLILARKSEELSIIAKESEKSAGTTKLDRELVV
jgi:hypothetical protein